MRLKELGVSQVAPEGLQSLAVHMCCIMHLCFKARRTISTQEPLFEELPIGVIMVDSSKPESRSATNIGVSSSLISLGKKRCQLPK